MNKVFGLISDYAAVKDDASRVVVSYDYDEVDGVNATWYEVYLYKNQISQLNIEAVKNAVIGDINARTDEKILKGFVWNGKPVYLSTENQFNFKSAYDLAVQTEGQNLPVKFKLGEDENGEPVYHTFNSVNSIADFYVSGVRFINLTLNEGWADKDAIDWTPYEEALAKIEEDRQAAEAARIAAEEEARAAEEAAKAAEESEKESEESE